jgi:hypothetical protein
MFQLALPILGSLMAPGPVGAVSMSLQSETTPYPGVTLREYRTSSPTTDTWVLLVDLCQSHVHIDATKAPDNYQSTGSWAEERGVQAATNGDFYTSGPQVYGDAVGEGIPWPESQTGTGSSHSGDWYYQDYGWIAFLHDGVEFTHTKWVKQNRSVSQGWQPETVAPEPPPGALALVSGFPELVIEGEPFTCDSPTDDDCFPDRSDMRDRHPRTAMGISEDHQRFILAVVDGRTSSSSGMYGAELADVMHQLGAWQAYNLDGGGSSQMWVSGDGYVNNYSGNNSGGGARSVGNHWGVFAGAGTGMPARAGHCVTAEPCGTIPATGGVIDDDDACFQLFGNMEYWRSVDDGYDGHLYWTNAWNTEQPDNWAWWRLNLARAGSYEVEVWAEADYAVYDQAHYVVMADGEEHTLSVDLSGADGWISLGTFDFAAGGEQWVAVYDDHDGSVDSNQRIPADAVRLTRIDEIEDTAPPDDSATPDDSDTAAEPTDSGEGNAYRPPGPRHRYDEGGCIGCHGRGRGSVGGAWALVALMLLPLRRRHRSQCEGGPSSPRSPTRDRTASMKSGPGSDLAVR